MDDCASVLFVVRDDFFKRFSNVWLCSGEFFVDVFCLGHYFYAIWYCCDAVLYYFFSVLSVYCFLNLPVPLYLAFFSDEFPVGFELVVPQFLSYVPCPAKVCDLQVI